MRARGRNGQDSTQSLSGLVTAVLAASTTGSARHLSQALTPQLRDTLVGLLDVSEGRQVSGLGWLCTRVSTISGHGMFGTFDAAVRQLETARTTISLAIRERLSLVAV